MQIIAQQLILIPSILLFLQNGSILYFCRFINSNTRASFSHIMCEVEFVRKNFEISLLWFHSFLGTEKTLNSSSKIELQNLLGKGKTL